MTLSEQKLPSEMSERLVDVLALDLVLFVPQLVIREPFAACEIHESKSWRLLSFAEADLDEGMRPG